MKLETSALITKGACLTYIPFSAALGERLPDDKPLVFGIPLKSWMVASQAGAAALVCFLSTSFGNFLRKNGTEPTVSK